MSKLQEEKVDDDDGYEYYAEDEDGEEESVPKGKIEEMLARRSKPKDLPKAPKLVPQERTAIEKFQEKTTTNPKELKPQTPVVHAEPKKREIAEETEIQKFDIDDLGQVGMVQKASQESIADYWNIPKEKPKIEVTEIEKLSDLQVERFSE